MRLNIKLILLLMFIGLLQCCEKKNYPYQEQLFKYFKSHNYEIAEKEKIIVILPLDGCSPCLESTLQLLIKNQESDFDLFIATRNKSTLVKYNIDELTLSDRLVVYDFQNVFEKYEIGVHAPMIFHFNKDECLFFAETTSMNLDKIKAYFNWI